MSYSRTSGDWLVGLVEILAMLTIMGPIVVWLLRHWAAIEAALRPTF